MWKFRASSSRWAGWMLIKTNTDQVPSCSSVRIGISAWAREDLEYIIRVRRILIFVFSISLLGRYHLFILKNSTIPNTLRISKAFACDKKAKSTLVEMKKMSVRKCAKVLTFLVYNQKYQCALWLEIFRLETNNHARIPPSITIEWPVHWPCEKSYITSWNSCTLSLSDLWHI